MSTPSISFSFFRFLSPYHLLSVNQGRWTNNQAEARQHYKRSLALYPVTGNQVKKGIVYLHLGLWWRSYALQQRREYEEACQQARKYFQQAIATFKDADRQDFVSKYISYLAEVLHRLEQWQELERIAKEALQLEQIKTSPFRQARMYGFLAEVALAKSAPEKARQQSQQALNLFAQAEEKALQEKQEDTATSLEWERHFHQGWYLFSLGKAQQQLGEKTTAKETLLTAKETTKPRYDPALYINILSTLWQIYFQQGEYLTAFELKQEQQTRETQFGFRAFTGASRLKAKQLVTNPALPPVIPGEISLEIKASGREQDVNKLVARVERSDYRLTIIHGQSGVGKSSLIEAGLIPALQQKRIEARQVLPVLQRVYAGWVKELGRCLQQTVFQQNQKKNLDSLATILAQLRENSYSNLLTVIIFDQFEEFFFVYKEPKQRKVFYKFLQDCLNIPFTKIILSLREDYLFYLLECNNRIVSLDVANNDILNKNILCYLGNFSQVEAKLVIENLTAKTQFNLEPELLDVLVKDLASDLGEVSPIELQVVGAQLQAENITQLAKYEELGSKEQLVNRFLDDVVKDCGKGNEQVTKLVLYLLTDENNTRPLKTRTILEPDFKGKEETFDLVLDILVQSGMVLRVPANPSDRYQLVHDYLVPFVRQLQSEKWIKELEKEREQRRIAEARYNDALKKQLKTARRSLIGLGLVATGIAGIAFVAATAALNGFAATLSLQASQDGIDRTITYIKAGKFLKLAPWKIFDAKMFTLISLHRAFYDDSEINRLEGHTRSIKDISFSTDKKHIVSASEDKTVKLWTIEGKYIDTLEGHTETVNDVEFSSDSKKIASASDDTTIKLWNIDGTIDKTFIGHKGKATKIRFSQDSQTLVSVAKDNIVMLWDLKNNKHKKLDHSDIYDFRLGLPEDDFFLVSTDTKGDQQYWDEEGNLLRQDLNEIETSQENTIVVNPTLTIDSSTPQNSFESGFGITAKIKENSNDITLLSSQIKPFEKYYQVKFSPDSQKAAVSTFKVEPYYIDQFYRVEFSHDSQRIAALSEFSIDIWQSNGKLIESIREYASDIAFSPNNNNLAFISVSDNINIWSADSKQLETIQSETVLSNIEYSADGQLIGANTGDSIKIWRRDGSLLKEFEGGTTVKFSPDSQLIAISNDKEIGIWRRDGDSLRRIAIEPKELENKVVVRFSPDSQLIVIGNYKETAILREDGSVLRKFKDVTEVEFSPDSQLIAVGNGKKIAIWKRGSNSLEEFDEAQKVIFSPDSQLIAIQKFNQVDILQQDGQLLKSLRGEIISFSNDSELVFINDQLVSRNSNGSVFKFGEQLNIVNTKDNLSKVKTFKDYKMIKISSDGQLVVTVDKIDQIKIWHLSSSLSKTLNKDDSNVKDIIISPGSDLIAAIFDKENQDTIKIWNRNGSLLEEFEGDYSDDISNYIVFSSQGDFIAVSSNNKQVSILSRSGNLINSFEEYSGQFKFLPNSSNFVFTTPYSRIKLWKGDSTSVQRFKIYDNQINAISYSPDSKLIASGSNDGKIQIWQSDGTLLKNIATHGERVNSIDFSPNGQSIVSASDEKTIELRKLDGTLTKTFDEHTKEVNDAKFTPKGNLIVSASDDGTVKLWKPNGTTSVKTLKYYENYSAKNINFSSDGKLLAVNFIQEENRSEIVAFWLIDGMFERYVPFSSFSGRDVSFSPDGKSIAFATYEGLISKSLELDELLQHGCDKIKGYLKNNPKVKESDRKLCDAYY